MLEKVLTNLEPTTIGLGLLVISLVVWFILFRKTYILPPGPKPWPLVGNAIEFYRQNNQHEWLAEMTKQYGPVFTFYLGTTPQIVLGKIDVINEVLVKNIDQYIHRVTPFHMRELTEGGSDMFNQDYSPRLKFQRKISKASLRNVMLNNNAISHVTNETLKRAFVEMDKCAETGEKYCPKDMVFCTTYAIFTELCLDKRFDLNDPQLKFLSYAFNNVHGLVDNSFVYWRDTLEFIFKYLPRTGAIKKAVDIATQFIDYCADDIEAKRKKQNELKKRKNGKKDVVEAILEALNERSGDEVDIVFEDKYLRQTVVEIFSGGADSDMVVIYNTLLELANNPEAQQAMADEIESVVGPHGDILADSRDSLPYCYAVLLEGMRLGPAATMTIHTCKTDSKLFGYDIPKNSPMYINIQGIQTDPDEWEEPWAFKPERWIAENGRIIKHKSYLPFSAGRRVCIGEAAAKAHMLVHIASLVQRYKFKQPIPGQKIEMVQSGGLFVHGTAYYVTLEKRFPDPEE